MSEKINHCKLCKQRCDSNFQTIDENTKDILEEILSKLNIPSIGDHLVCKNCEKNLRTYFDVKSTCLYSQACIGKSNKSNNTAQNLTNDILNNDLVCRFCMETITSNTSAPLTEPDEDAMFLKVRLETYFPELLNVSQDLPSICTPCQTSFQNCIGFIMRAERNLLEYCDVHVEDYKNEIDVNDSLKLTAEKSEHSRSLVKTENEGLVKVRCEDIVELETQVKNEESQLNSCQIQPELIQTDAADTSMYNCDACPYKTKYKYSLKLHALLHKPDAEIPKYKCDKCPHQTKYRYALKLHMLVHRDVAETPTICCEICGFLTAHKYYLRRHMLVHKDQAEVQMFNCPKCEYVTKYKSKLKVHMLKHERRRMLEGTATRQAFKCSSCDYETLLKSSLKRHMFLHQSVAELTMYKCTQCRYETKYRSNLNNHALIHKKVTDVTMFKCVVCDYETRHKNYLKDHMLRHKTASEVTIFKCDLCPFETKHRGNVRKHAIRHKSPKEVAMYKCEMCTFQSRYKRGLKAHILTHEVHKCGTCGFVTRDKAEMGQHDLRHRSEEL